MVNAMVLVAGTFSWLGPAQELALNGALACAFLLELLCRLQAEGPRAYFKVKPNWYDFGFVVVSVVDALVTRLVSSGVMSGLRFVRIIRGVRTQRQALWLFKLLAHVQQSQAWLTRLTGVLFFICVSAELKVMDLQSVIGMLGIFAVLLLMRRWSSPNVTKVVYKALEPGKGFLVKWATLFFAPALVKLPLVRDNFSVGILARLAALLLLGFLGTLLSTAAIASLFPAHEKPAEKPLEAAAEKAAEETEEVTREPAVPAPVVPDPQPDRRPYKKRLLGVYAACMIVSVLAVRFRCEPIFLWCQNAFMLSSSLLGFVAGMLSPKKVQSFVHPMFVCILMTWLAAAAWGNLTGVSSGFFTVIGTYSTMPGAGGLLSFMLGPTVIALGVLLFERRRLLLGELLPMIATCTVTAFTSLFYTAFLARALGLPSNLAVASLLRCISSPFAGDLTGLIGASSTYAIAMIVVTGFIGVLLGQPIFNLLALRNPRTRGLAMGAAAHGLGTVALADSDQDAFPYSALSFVLVGTATSAFMQVPLVRGALLKILLG